MLSAGLTSERGGSQQQEESALTASLNSTQQLEPVTPTFAPASCYSTTTEFGPSPRRTDSAVKIEPPFVWDDDGTSSDDEDDNLFGVFFEQTAENNLSVCDKLLPSHGVWPMQIREVQADIKSVLRVVNKALRTEENTRRMQGDVFPSRKERLLDGTSFKLADASSKLRACIEQRETLRKQTENSMKEEDDDTTRTQISKEGDRERLLRATLSKRTISIEELQPSRVNDSLMDISRRLVDAALLVRAEYLFLAVDVLLLAASVSRCVSVSGTTNEKSILGKCAQIINQAAEICASFKNNLAARRRAHELYSLSADLFSSASMRIQRNVQERRAREVLSSPPAGKSTEIFWNY